MNKYKKAFTLIELIVVVAVVGILVLLAAPRFIGYTQRAELARIQHDVRVMEQEVGAMLITNDDDFNKWENNNKDFNQLTQENKLFDKEGPVEKVESADKTYKIIPEEYSKKINTKLKGTFYANSDGKVYYEHVKPLFGKTTGPENPDPEEPGEPGEPGEKDPEEPGNPGPVCSDEDVNNEEGLMNPIEPRNPIEGEIAIDSAEELAKIGKSSEYPLNGKYILTANIDLSGFNNWVPIGSYTSSSDKSPFTGSFDGNGYKITGLTINRPETDYVGLFGYTEGDTISNVALECVNITGKYYVGGLVGRATRGTSIYSTTKISNSYATGSVIGTGSVGGLVGSARDNTTISYSYATGSVTGTGYSNVGGLVGTAYDGTNIEKSYATGAVKGGVNIGGLVGEADDDTIIRNTYATGEVTATSFTAGGLVGRLSGVDSAVISSYATGRVTAPETRSAGGLVASLNVSMIINSFWDTETTGQERSAASGTTTSFGKTTEEMKKKDTYKGTYSSWDFETIWKIEEGEDYPKFRKLTGSENPAKPEEDSEYSNEEIQNLINKGYIPIATAEELNNIRNTSQRTFGEGTDWKKEYAGGLRKQYVQVANIDLSEYSEKGWTPIGTSSESESFRGTYDGGNYVIRDLEVKGEGEHYQGLFGSTSGATILNVALEDINVAGSRTGGLVGWARNGTTISNSYATGSVKGTGNSVGGLVGQAYEDITISNSYATVSVEGTGAVGGLVGTTYIRAIIENSYATGSVTSSGDRVGGLVGALQGSNTKISNSYATGEVTGSGGSVGGLVGRAFNGTAISSSYATGSVTGANQVGGLVGSLVWSTYNNTIDNSYSTGSVTGEDNVGGLVGDANRGTISNSYAIGEVTGTKEVGGLVGTAESRSTIRHSYWDIETTGQKESARGGLGKTTEEMKKKDTYQDTYLGWDFNTVWKIYEGKDYPKLR